MAKVPEVSPATYHLSGELRRCAIYAVVGAVLFAGALIAMPRFMDFLLVKPDPKPLNWKPLSWVGVALAFAAYVSQVRVRVDGRGVARWRPWGWDVWPWWEFASGTIRREPSPYIYLRPKSAPFWSRRLSLEGLNEDGREAIEAAIRHCWVAPAEDDLPAEITVRPLFGPKLTATAEGLRVEARRESRWYRWGDVRRLTFRRYEHDRTDFLEAEIELSDRKIKLAVDRSHGNLPTWTGPSADVVGRTLLRHVPPERIRAFAENGPPRSWDEYLDRLAKIERRERDSRQLGGILVPVLVAIAVLFLWDTPTVWIGVLKFLFMPAPLFLMFGGVYYYLVKDVRHSRERLEDDWRIGRLNRNREAS